MIERPLYNWFNVQRGHMCRYGDELVDAETAAAHLHFDNHRHIVVVSGRNESIGYITIAHVNALHRLKRDYPSMRFHLGTRDVDTKWPPALNA